MAKLIPEYVRGISEEAVVQSAFELMFAFDEVISLGHKENVNVMVVT